jgi:hypothetical protein
MNRTSRPDRKLRWSRRLAVASAVMIPVAVASAALSAEEQPAPSAPISLGDAARKLKAPKGDASIAAVECTGPVGLYSLANNRYVSAELGYGGGDHAMLRARATVLAPWEEYDLCYDNTRGTFSFHARGNDRYVSAELGYGGGDHAMLRARATVVDAWERFHIIDHGSYINIKSAANDRLVSAELGYRGDDYAMLRARATEDGPWERFE